MSTATTASPTTPDPSHLLIENQRLRQALERIANQGPNFGPDGTYKTWQHWSEIARQTLDDLGT